jgi:hypothetical protein
MSGFDDDQDHQDLSYVPGADALGDDFWDDIPVVGPATQAGLNLAGLLPYTDALREMFPQAVPFVGMVRGTVETPLTCTTLGSSVVSFKNGIGKWTRSLTTHPIPPINWARPHGGARLPPTAEMASRPCKSPQEFRQWLNWVASKILQGGCQALADGLHQDNYIPDLRFILQVAHDLHMIGATFDLVSPNLHTLQWTPDPQSPLTHTVPFLAKGHQSGLLKLTYREGHWKYGAVLKDIWPGSPDMKFKHQAPAHVMSGPDGTAAAKLRAESLFYTKVFEWLVSTALTNPVLRGV